MLLTAHGFARSPEPMTLAAVVSPYQPINGLTGLGLNAGALYIGVDGSDPETTPQACFWDAAGTIPATQPVQIMGGYPMRLGTPTRLYTGPTYSMRARDASGAQVFYEAHCVPAAGVPDPVAELASLGVFPTRAAAIAANISAALQATGITLLGYTTAGDDGGAQYRYRVANPGHAGAFQSADGAWWEISESPLNLHQFGAVGDGVTDDATAINNCSACAVVQGVREIAAIGGKTYHIASSLLPRQNMVWDFAGATVHCSAGVYIWYDNSDATKVQIGTVVGDVVGPTTQLPLSSVVGLAVGDWVAVRLGDNAYDHAEPRYAFAAKVLAIVGATITLDHVIPYSISTSTATNPANHTVYKLQGDNPINVTWRDMNLKCPVGPGVEGGIGVRWGVNLRIENVGGNLDSSGEMGAGLVGLMQFCRDVIIDGARLYANFNTRGQASLGRMFNFSNCINVDVIQPIARNLNGPMAFVESYCENITFHDPVIEVRQAIAAASYVCFGPVQESECRIVNPAVFADFQITSFIDQGGSPGPLSPIKIEGIYKWRGPMPRSFWADPTMMCGVLDYANGPDFVVVDYTKTSWRSFYVPAVANLATDAFFPGPLIGVYVAQSSGVVAASLTNVYLGYEGNNGASFLPAASAPGTVAEVGHRGAGTDYGGLDQLSRMGKVLVALNANVQPAGAFVGILACSATVIASSQAHIGPGGVTALNDTYLARLLKGVSP